jgi:putative flippase GtrA
MGIHLQFSRYVVVGVTATLSHYSVLVGLVELGKWPPVPATMVGFTIGGIVSYLLNRRHTFVTDRSHAEATWRFAVVVSFVFCITYVMMNFFVNHLGAPYLPAQVVTTGSVMFVSFFSHRFWTFADSSARS